MSSSAASLLDVPTSLRRLHVGEAPYPGQLHSGDPQTVWVDLDVVPADVWRCAPDGHILTPIDVARTPEGHAAIVPHCPQRLVVVACAPRSAGEIVTIAVSVLRAAHEARHAGLIAGSWWIDGAGRPVLAISEEGAWGEEAVEVIAGLTGSAGPAMRSALEAVGRLLAADRPTAHETVTCEEALFDLSDPMPLAVTAGHREDGSPGVPSPRRAQSLHREATVQATEGWLARFTDTEWAARVTDAVRAVAALPARLGAARRPNGAIDREKKRRGDLRVRREAVSSRTRTARRPASPREGRAGPARQVAPRRGVWVVAVAVAGVILLGGVLWPEPGSPPPRPAVAAEETGAPSTGSTATAPASAAPAEPGATDGGLEDAARHVLRAAAACAPAGDCATLLETTAATLPDGVVAHASDTATVTLLDEYGGVAVFRVEAPTASPQILVLVSADGKWLVRDVYDVADQP